MDNTPTTVIGQTEALRTLNIVAPAHVLLVGNPGMGKTHIAFWYAEQVSNWNRRNVAHIWRIDAPAAGEISYTGTGWGNTMSTSGHNLGNFPGPIIIDEAQGLRNSEVFYPLLDQPVAEGRGWARTYIFTTTDEGELPPALISRLQVVALAPYTTEELAEIAVQGGPKLSYEVRQVLCEMCHGSPRRTEQYARLLQNVGDKHGRTIQPKEVHPIMRFLGYPEGLNSRELQILEMINQEPRSISTLAATLGTGIRTIKLWETEMIAAGLMTISSRGRSITDQGKQVLTRAKGTVDTMTVKMVQNT